MSADGPFQYVPLDKLKLYQNGLLVNNLLRRLNFSTSFTLTEVPGTDSVDIGIGTEIQGLGDLVNVAIVSPIAKQVLRYDGSEWKNDFLNLDDLGDAVITSPQTGMTLRYDGTNWVNAFPFFDDLIDAIVSNPQAQQVIRHNGISWLNAFLSSSDLSDVEITAPSTGQILRYDGTNFVNVAASAISLLLNDLTDVIITAASSGQFLGYNGSNWVNTLIALDALSDVVIGSLATGQTIQYNGTNWVNVIAALDYLTDVVINSPTNGQVIQYNGTNWVNASPTPGVVNLDDLGDVATPSPAAGNIIRYDGANWVNVALAELLALTNLSDVSISAPTSGHILTFSGGSWINQAPPPSEGGANALTDLTDVNITAAASGDILRHNGTSWVDIPIAELLSLTQLSDVAISSPATAQVTRYNGSAWINAILNINDLTPVSITTPSSGQLLSYNGTNWVNATVSQASEVSFLPDIVNNGSNWGLWSGGARFGTGFFAGCYTELNGDIRTRQDSTTGNKVCTEFVTGSANDDQAGYSGHDPSGTNPLAPAAGFYITRDQDPHLKIRFQVPDVATVRFVIGFAVGNDLPGNAEFTTSFPSATAAFLFYFSSTSTTNLNVIRNDTSGSAVLVDTGTPVAVNTPIVAEIIAESANNRIGWRINEGSTTFYTTDIPPATTSMNYFVRVETKTGASKRFTQYYCYITQKPV